MGGMIGVDVAIVGAGPAGSALAVLLGRQGMRVLLIDRSCFPRPKVCGEYMSPEALSILGELGVCPATLHDFNANVNAGNLVDVLVKKALATTARVRSPSL